VPPGQSVHPCMRWLRSGQCSSNPIFHGPFPETFIIAYYLYTKPFHVTQ
jgi:hypothetical protein